MPTTSLPKTVGTSLSGAVKDAIKKVTTQKDPSNYVILAFDTSGGDELQVAGLGSDGLEGLKKRSAVGAESTRTNATLTKQPHATRPRA